MASLQAVPPAAGRPRPGARQRHLPSGLRPTVWNPADRTSAQAARAARGHKEARKQQSWVGAAPPGS
eukprot:CAMPEP_0197889158 /NCGR_PEP_ID=MMETSP1439-20131203/23625_1 /TAXON_ID=66791 /ORGANISM="Gonyaulax spinifera, Strain CCMP409" /LENGTH=66 /DNA_ID=CAMNT_0043509113 /DNA_START=31 /DNA_END=228 /DNA_ORIENTATION=-